MLVQVYGREAVSRKFVTNGPNAFAKGRKLLRMSHVRVGHGQAESRYDRESATNAGTRLATDSKIDSGGIGISKDTVHIIIREDLGKRKICSRFVPHKLTDEQKAKRIETSGNFFPCVTRIHCFWKTSSRVLPVRSGIKTAIDGNQKRVVCKRPRNKTVVEEGIIYREFVPALMRILTGQF